MTAAQGVTPVLISPSAQTLGSSAVLVSSLPFLARLPVHGALELWLLEVASLLTPVAIMTEFEATAVVAVATPRCPLLPLRWPATGRARGGLLLCHPLLLLGVSAVFFVLVLSRNRLQNYRLKFGLLLKMGSLVEVLAITRQRIVGCLHFLARAGLRAFVSSRISSHDRASSEALSCHWICGTKMFADFIVCLC